MSKPKKQRLAVMVDLETLCTRKNAAVIDIALIAIHLRGGQAESLELEIQVSPASYEGDFTFSVSPATMDFHQRQNSGLLEKCRMVGMDWREAAARINQYLSSLSSAYEVHLWARGKDFDGPILENLLFRAGFNDVPWKFSNMHCLRDLCQLFPEVKQASYGNHTALADARAQVTQLLDIASYSERASNYIFGRE